MEFSSGEVKRSHYTQKELGRGEYSKTVDVDFTILLLEGREPGRLSWSPSFP